jgi:tetratricopeptide (TPR) repeat protein
MAACLAEGLHYAHDRGLVHFDVKPANILIAADGQPMLLDFHLAREPLIKGAPLDRVGGTPGYMAPELEAAFAAAREGRPCPRAVDGRADVYALGVVAEEALACEQGAGAATAKRGVSTGLRDVIAKCLAPIPERRYASAADLRRHLADLPLQGVANRNVLEQGRKWLRRRPHTLVQIVLLVAAVGGTAAAVWSACSSAMRTVRDAEASLADARSFLKDRRYDEAARSADRGLQLVDSLRGQDPLRQALGSCVRRAQRGAAADRLHSLAERLRLLCGAQSPPQREFAAVAGPCRDVWAERTRLLDAADELEGSTEDRIRVDLVDLATLWPDLAVRTARPADRETQRLAALARLEEAKALFPRNPVLEHQGAVLLRALGRSDGTALQETMSPRTAWDHYVLGRDLLSEGDAAGAEVEFDRSLELDPQSFWANLSRGLGAFRREHFEDAVASFGVCVALAPHRAECYYNRALALAAAGRTDRAARDYDRALELDPNYAEAALNRGLLRYREKRYAEALGDVQRALDAGADSGAGAGYYALALIYLAREEDVRARASLEACLRSNPDSKEATELYDQLGGAPRRPPPPPPPGSKPSSPPAEAAGPARSRSTWRLSAPATDARWWT